jgi:uncharacterized membrane protein YfcA
MDTLLLSVIIGLAAGIIMIPVLIHVGHTDKKPLPVIVGNTIIIGTLIGIAGYFLR